MRGILQSFVFSLVAIFGTSQIITGFSYGNDVVVLVFSAFVFGVVNSYLRPILELITLPLNIVTLGLTSLLINVGLLFVTVRIVPGLYVGPFYFGGFQLDLPGSYPNISIPAGDVPVILTLWLTSLLISVFMIVLGIVFETDR